MVKEKSEKPIEPAPEPVPEPEPNPEPVEIISPEPETVSANELRTRLAALEAELKGIREEIKSAKSEIRTAGKAASGLAGIGDRLFGRRKA